MTGKNPLAWTAELCLFAALAASAMGGETPGARLDYPRTVKAGEAFTLTVHADPAADADAVAYTFNGVTRRVLRDDARDFALFNAVDRIGKGVKTADGAAAAAGPYQTLAAVPFPADGRKRAVWLRYKGGELCVRRPEKEIKWLWTKPAEFAWVSAGVLDAETVGPLLTIMGGKEPRAVLDRILFANPGNKGYRPVDPVVLPNVFTWTPDRSAVGSHNLEVTVGYTSGGRTTTAKQTAVVEVLPPAAETPPPGNAPAFALAPNRQEDITPTALNVSADALPLFRFQDDAYTAKVRAMPFGLRFPDRFLLPLRCRAYPDLPDRVEIPVGRTVGGLAFLLTEYWQGDVDREMAHFLVEYEDGASLRLPLREEIELCGSLRELKARDAWFAGAVSSPGMAFHLTVFAWPNPHPEKKITRLVFSNIRTVFSKEENKDIPLNVADIASQMLLGLVAVKDPADARALAEATRPAPEAEAAAASVTVDFGRPEHAINPYLFSTNESGVLNPEAGFDEYLELMDEVGCRLFRFHSGWRPELVYPDKLENPRYDKLVAVIRRMYAAMPNARIMPCINRIPEYVDPKTPEGRELFADICADLVRELNVKEKLGIEYWEIYNEVYFRQIDEDRALWRMYNLAARKMKAVDPAIKIGGYAPNWPVLANIRDFYKNCHENVDFISWHKYPTGSVSLPTRALMDRTPSFGDDARRIDAMVEEITPGRKVEQAVTEYNLNFNWRPHDPRQADPIGAAWLASTLHHLAKAGVAIAQTWHSRGGGTFGLFSRNNEPRPAAQVLYLANTFVKGDQVRSASDAASIECLAFRHADAAGVLLVNKSDAERRVSLNLLNRPAFVGRGIRPATDDGAVSAAGFVLRQSDHLTEPVFDLVLAPYEVRLLSRPLKGTSKN